MSEKIPAYMFVTWLLMALSFVLSMSASNTLPADSYGMISFNSSSGFLEATTVQNTPVLISGYNLIQCQNFKCTNQSMNATLKQTYQLTAGVTFSAAGTGDYSLTLFQNGLALNGCTTVLEIPAISLKVSTSFSCIASVSPLDEITLKITGLGAIPSATTVYDASIITTRVG